MKRTTLGSSADRCAAGVRGEALRDAERCPEDDLLESLIRHRPRLRLETVRIEHVADARADDPVQLLGLLSHRFLE